ncbi:hypothetical protein M8C21_024942 [Ambrosia artemisiifolia]|uniref:Oleosin n=1 Tax=Ambrosia artemisiifolia TaxID=4212 RepID=A0AAD5GN36_AMBAR|nr:hypothetical protein M8C21_024942 [Ambrosia artemisiifolia]
MADHHHDQPYDYQQQDDQYSTSKLLAVLTLFPIGGLGLLFSGLILIGTLIGLTIATPLFFILSPIFVPAILTVTLTVSGFWASGVLGITGLSSLAYIASYLRRTRGGRRRLVHDYGKRTHEMDWA